MKLKALAAGVALVLGAGGAHATIATGASGTGPGEFFLSVFDPVAQKSYSQDLNVDMFLFLTDSNYQFHNSKSWSVALDPLFGQFYTPANANQTVYNVAATDLDNGKLNSLDPTYGYVTSFNQANPVPVLHDFVGSVSDPGDKARAKAVYYNIDPADAGIHIPGTFQYYTLDWSNDFGGKIPASENNQGKLNEVLDVWLHGLNAVYGIDELGDPYIRDRWVKMPGTFQLTPTALHYTVETAAVPIPGALWLFGGALASLIGVRQRKRVVPV